MGKIERIQVAPEDRERLVKLVNQLGAPDEAGGLDLPGPLHSTIPIVTRISQGEMRQGLRSSISCMNFLQPRRASNDAGRSRMGVNEIRSAAVPRNRRPCLISSSERLGDLSAAIVPYAGDSA
jgi:hypothetical protein